MNQGRRMITADRVGNLHLEKDANYFLADMGERPQTVQGRGVQVFMTDGVLADLLTHLALDDRWSAAFDAVAADREARIAEAAGTRTLPEQLRSRARLAVAMRSAIVLRDEALSGGLAQAAERQQILRTASLPGATDDAVERAVNVAQGTQTRIRSERSENTPSRYDNDGTDRQSYEDPCCGNKSPHDPHFHAPIGGLRLNCCGVASRPVHRLNLPASAPLEGEDQYAMLVAYGGAILHAESGCVTELVRPDGQVAARIVPA